MCQFSLFISCHTTAVLPVTLHKPVWQAFHGHHFAYQLKIYYTFRSKVHPIILFFSPNIIIIKYANVFITYNSDNINFDFRVCSGFNDVYLKLYCMITKTTNFFKMKS